MRIKPRLENAEQLQKDLAFEREFKLTLRFAADFNVLFLYAYPGAGLAWEFEEELGSEASLPDRLEAIGRQRIAVTDGLLSMLSPPVVLLPPYIRELEAHMISRSR